ncbi:thermonuclease family protein [Pusillimonas sp. DMV24BSW_D]|uniref:thermonuclease family protein n=1 Tax=Neopusillimonas aestuarii TaxID=2716226 RepID=UPI00140CE27E|nr:thermonuclease family protein [Pusillimonas sp. DMV24BSW_D]QIM49862.1 thermonuclease family protein [Pusillimonas sp. DMV24BSW_D]
MKYRAQCFFLLAAALFSSAAATAAGRVPSNEETRNKTVQCEVTSVHDGDSMRARCPGMKDTVRIRIHQIDAPEIGQAYGKTSRDTLRRLCVRGRTAAFSIVGKDDYGRLLAGVECRQKDVATTMLESGAAWVYRQYQHDKMLVQMEQRAREAKRGLWQNPNAQAPWEYRRDRR